MGTARHALELGVPIGVVPSAPDDPCYAGAIALIRDGADAIVDGRSLFLRLELHGVMRPGSLQRPRVAPGSTLSGAGHGSAGANTTSSLALLDHPLASLLRRRARVEEHRGARRHATCATLAACCSSSRRQATSSTPTMAPGLADGRPDRVV